MKAKVIALVAVVAMSCPLLARASLLGDWQGTFLQTFGGVNSGTVNFHFLTSTPDSGAFDLTGTAAISCAANAAPNCGFNPDFTGTFNATTNALALALTPAPGSGNAGTNISATLSADSSLISGTYAAVDGSTGGTFSVTPVPLPAAGGLLALGISVIGAARRRRTQNS
jgi:hypothetical protein